jgi:hypothetical protein
MRVVNITGQGRRGPKSECKQFDEQLGLFGNYSRPGVRETAHQTLPCIDSGPTITLIARVSGAAPPPSPLS